MTPLDNGSHRRALYYPQKNVVLHISDVSHFTCSAGPESFKKMFGGNVTVHGTPTVTVIESSGTIFNNSRHETNINSFNLRNSTVVQSFNDESVVDNAPHGFHKRQDDRRASAAPNSGVKNAMDLGGTLKASVKRVAGRLDPLAPQDRDSNIYSKNIFNSRFNNVANDGSSVKYKEVDPDLSGSDSEDTDRLEDRPEFSRVKSDPQTAHSFSNGGGKDSAHRPGFSQYSAQSTPAYPAHAKNPAVANATLPPRHAAVYNNMVDLFNNPTTVLSTPFELVDDAHTVTNINSHNIVNCTVMDSLNDNSQVIYRRD